jgi:ribosomal protein L18
MNIKTFRLGLALSLLLPTAACAGFMPAGFLDPRIADARQRLAALPVVTPRENLVFAETVRQRIDQIADYAAGSDQGLRQSIERCHQEKVSMSSSYGGFNTSNATQNRWEVAAIAQYQQCVNAVIGRASGQSGGLY